MNIDQKRTNCIAKHELEVLVFLKQVVHRERQILASQLGSS